MRIINGVNNIERLKKPVVALGVFDGVHRGHRAVLDAAVKKARVSGGTSVAMTFWPHPQGKESLYSCEHRLRIIAETGIDVCVVIDFSAGFARMTATDFIEIILCRKLGASAVFVGENYRFGRGARGDCATLRELSRPCGFSVRSFKTRAVKGRAISSTFIRALIKDGDIAAAARLLARPVSVLGTVVKGGAWARKMGFPTANLKPHHEVIPPAGIYAAKVVSGNAVLPGICYIGTDPTLKLRRPLHVEAHIFDFKKNIYGSVIEVQFIKKIRNEATFPTPAALIEQIHKDIASARRILSRNK